MRVSTRFLSLNRANKSVNVLFEEQDEKRGKSDDVKSSEFFILYKGFLRRIVKELTIF